MKNFASAGGLRPRLVITLTITTLITGILATACQETNNTNQGNSGQTNSPSATPAATTNTKGLKIGSLLPATGDLAPLGQAMIASVPLAVEKANQCGE